jgi:hypothetical protein
MQSRYFLLLADYHEKARVRFQSIICSFVQTVFVVHCSKKLESRVQADFDLKLSDTLRYYMRDSKAALDLMYRRSRCLADFDTANKSLDRARQKNKDLQQAEIVQQNIKKKFETISDNAKDGAYLFNVSYSCR